MGRIERWAARLAIVSTLPAIIPLLKAQEPDESPQALIVAASGGYISRQGALTELSARPGMVTFAGDSLRSAGGSVTFLSCGAKSQQTLSPEGEVVFGASGASLRKGRFTEQTPGGGCYLEPMPRSIVASRRDAGASVSQQMARGIAAQTFEQRLGLLSDEQRRELAVELPPLESSLQANPADPLQHLAKAELLSRSNLPWDAAQELGVVIQSWPDAAWARSRKVTLEQMAARGFRTAEHQTADGQTFALLVGVSDFQDPDITPLHYAHADAVELQTLLESPRAGGIPEKNIVRLINKDATAARSESRHRDAVTAQGGQ